MIEDPKLNGPAVTVPAADAIAEVATTWRRSGRKPTRKPARPKPTHYKVICVSTYTKDLERLDNAVAELKRRGKTKMTRSELIRLAVANLNIDEVA